MLRITLEFRGDFLMWPSLKKGESHIKNNRVILKELVIFKSNQVI